MSVCYEDEFLGLWQEWQNELLYEAVIADVREGSIDLGKSYYRDLGQEDVCMVEMNLIRRLGDYADGIILNDTPVDVAFIIDADCIHTLEVIDKIRASATEEELDK